MSKIKYPLIVFMQRSENDLQTELNLLRQAKKAVAKLLNSYVEAVHFNRQEYMLALEKAYEDMAKLMFSGSSEIPPIRVSCGLDPVPGPLPEAVADEPFIAMRDMEQREIDGVQFLGRSEVLDALGKGIQEAADETN